VLARPTEEGRYTLKRNSTTLRNRKPGESDLLATLNLVNYSIMSLGEAA